MWQYATRLEKITEARKGIATVFTVGCSNGFKVPPAEETLRGALNAVKAFVDHVQKIEGDRYAYISRNCLNVAIRCCRKIRMPENHLNGLVRNSQPVKIRC